MSDLSEIKNSFLPDFYQKEIQTSHDDLCLIRRNGFGRYCLYVTRFNPSIDVREQIDIARSAVRKLTKAFYIFAEVGVYIVFKCPKPPRVKETELEVDLSGFHAVIVQGVHIMPDSGKHTFKHSKWFNRTFGGADKIAPMLQDIAKVTQ